MDDAERAAFDAWARSQMKERRARDRAAAPEMKERRKFLLELVKEAQANPKTDDPAGLKRRVLLRYEKSAIDTCVWCGVDPPRGKTYLCQVCNMCRRENGRPPTEKNIDKRRDNRVEAEADRNR